MLLVAPTFSDYFSLFIGSVTSSTRPVTLSILFLLIFIVFIIIKKTIRFALFFAFLATLALAFYYFFPTISQVRF